MSQLTTSPSVDQSSRLSQPLLAVASLDWERIAFISLVLLALLTRFWDLGSRVVSHDESLHTQYSYQYYNGDGYRHTPLMHGPFLFHVTALTYWLFGDNDLTARIPVALLGVLLVAMPYFLRRWLGRSGALFTSFLFLISPYLTYYNRYIRHDTPVIIWALIAFIALVSYLYHQRHERYLWWLAAALALMFSTKEVSYIYVAIFGSFLLLRLGVQVLAAPWLKRSWPRWRQPLAVVALGLLLFGGAFLTQRSLEGDVTTAGGTATVESEAFAADPSEALATPVAEAESGNRGVVFARWLQISGLAIFVFGAFLVVQEFRSELEQYASFDLIMLFTALILPLLSPFVAVISGWTARDYQLQRCVLANEESMSGLAVLTGKLFNLTCWQAFWSSGVVHVSAFLIVMLFVGVLLGLWWQPRRFIIAALIFHGIFLVLYTSMFTHMGGWFSGIVDSLAYWMEQQEVQRGGQPWFYYLFVAPFYEFLPLTFALLAIRHWARQNRLNRVLGYWLGLALASLLTYSLTNWLLGLSARASGGQAEPLLAVIAGAVVFGVGLLVWILVYAGRLRQVYGLGRSWRGLVSSEALLGFVPLLIWWLVLTFVLYSVAGEKMPWLSTHFVIPMGFLSGWYLNERLRQMPWAELLSRPSLTRIGLAVAFLIALFLTLSPLWLGQVAWGQLEADNLSGIGRFLGSALVAGILYYLLRRQQRLARPAWRGHAWIFGSFILLSLLTIRFNYMANVTNADYTNEFMVYAHGAPATKQMVMAQVEDLSMRLNGDLSLKVAFDNDTSWPMTWYLRNYPNQIYFGENPGRNILEAPIVIVGSVNWSKVEPILRDDYESFTYTFLWWPMEDYRNISWDAIFGTGVDRTAVPEGLTPPERGLGSAALRRALWNIFFYRDYTAYGEVFGRNYTAGEWPLRRDLRVYIRRDSLAQLYDYGVSAVSLEPRVDPYAENELQLVAVQSIGTAGQGPGQLSSPRNVAVAPNGNLYVVDSGNHRLQVFAPDGSYRFGWGSFGEGEGQFNEPWGLAIDERFVYVADTWNHRVQKFTLDGEFVSTIGRSGSPADGQVGGGLFFGPRSIILLPENRLLVSDTGNHRLQLFDRDGVFLQQVGGYGFSMGQFYEPVGLAAAPDGSVYLADTWNRRIQLLSPDLFAIAEWEVDAWVGESINNKPYMAVDGQGRLYVSDPENFRILVFDATGRYLARFGHFGQDLGSFALPNGLAVDAAGHLYVADAANNRVLHFAPLPLAAPEPAPGSDLEDPAGAGVGPDNGGLNPGGAGLLEESDAPAGDEAPGGEGAEPTPTPAG